MTRNGKIARLPHDIRTQLNRRLHDGEQGKTLVQWLNSLPEVRKIMARDFEGRPIKEQNLTEWKQGGFIDWLNRQAFCDQLGSLIDLSEDLEDVAGDSSVANRLASIVAADLAMASRLLQTQSSDVRQRFDILCKTAQSLRHLHHAEAVAARERRAAARWQRECRELEQKRLNAEIDAAVHRAKAPLLEAVMRPALIAMYGGGETGAKAADLFIQIQRAARALKDNAPLPPMPNPASSTPNQPQSPSIKPDQTSHTTQPVDP
jgi:hypothetical protein